MPLYFYALIVEEVDLLFGLAAFVVAQEYSCFIEKEVVLTVYRYILTLLSAIFLGCFSIVTVYREFSESEIETRNVKVDV